MATSRHLVRHAWTGGLLDVLEGGASEVADEPEGPMRTPSPIGLHTDGLRRTRGREEVSAMRTVLIPRLRRRGCIDLDRRTPSGRQLPY
jgi:hypothetical protein